MPGWDARSTDRARSAGTGGAARTVIIVLCLLLLVAFTIAIGTGTVGEHTLRPAPATSSITIP